MVVANNTSDIDDVFADGVADVSSRTRIGTGFGRTEYLPMDDRDISESPISHILEV